MTQHQVSNVGPNELKLIDSEGEMHTVKPGEIWIGGLRSIYQGHQRAEYSVEPFDGKPK